MKENDGNEREYQNRVSLGSNEPVRPVTDTKLLSFAKGTNLDSNARMLAKAL